MRARPQRTDDDAPPRAAWRWSGLGVLAVAVALQRLSAVDLLLPAALVAAGVAVAAARSDASAAQRTHRRGPDGER